MQVAVGADLRREEFEFNGDRFVFFLCGFIRTQRVVDFEKTGIRDCDQFRSSSQIACEGSALYGFRDFRLKFERFRTDTQVFRFQFAVNNFFI